MSDASVAAEPSMDEILIKIQRTIAMDGRVESPPTASIRPLPLPHMLDQATTRHRGSRTKRLKR
jgi:hypothetical protein